MLKDFSWYVFSRTGNPDAYLLYKGILANDVEKEKQEITNGVSENIRNSNKGNSTGGIGQDSNSFF